MSQANVDYVLRHNPQLNPSSVEVCPNSIEPKEITVSDVERADLRARYNLPHDTRIFVYGGNLGKPQDITFIIKCLRFCRKMNAYFLIVGNGTEFNKLQKYIDKYNQDNVLLLQYLPKEDYDRLVAACDVGLIFLDHRFTIPNFPSRLLSYMQAKLPIIACTDKNTDIGNVITGINKDDNKTHDGFGWWCESNDVRAFAKCVNEALHMTLEELNTLGDNAYEYLIKHYDVRDAANLIIKYIQ